MNRPNLAHKALSLLEQVIDECIERAVARHTPPAAEQSLWVDLAEAQAILGAGYDRARILALAHRGEIVFDRKDPDKPQSPYIFARHSLLEYHARRLFQLDQASPRNGRVSKRKAA